MAKKKKRGRPSMGRSEYLEVRLTPEEKSRYEQAASATGLALSDWVRVSLTAISARHSDEGAHEMAAARATARHSKN